MRIFRTTLQLHNTIILLVEKIMNHEYICALSGKQAQENTLIDGGDELGDIPLNWTKITIQTRKINPDYQMLQLVKSAMVAQLNTQIDPKASQDEQNIAKISIRMQVDAQFAALEDRMTPFLIEEIQTFISDPSADTQLQDAWLSLLENLDLAEEAEEENEKSITAPSKKIEKEENAAV